MSIQDLDEEEQEDYERFDYQKHTGFTKSNWGFDPIDLDEWDDEEWENEEVVGIY